MLLMAGSGKTSPSEIGKSTGMAKIVNKSFPLTNITIFSPHIYYVFFMIDTTTSHHLATHLPTYPHISSHA
jgi:hypothetical protein